ncbi:putative transposon, En/Spm-like, transposase-associated domain protein [Tanacetum coccineum]
MEKKSPGQNINVFLRPLVDELITLYNDGIETYDAARKENFIMKVVLLWTVSDFLAYAMLSGWSTHGKLACPYCMGNSGSFQLEHGGKPCWFDCHRKFLPSTHPYRKDKRGFIARNVVLGGPPLELNGDQIRNKFVTIQPFTKAIRIEKPIRNFLDLGELIIG